MSSIIKSLFNNSNNGTGGANISDSAGRQTGKKRKGSLPKGKKSSSSSSAAAGHQEVRAYRGATYTLSSSSSTDNMNSFAPVSSSNAHHAKKKKSALGKRLRPSNLLNRNSNSSSGRSRGKFTLPGSRKQKHPCALPPSGNMLSPIFHSTPSLPLHNGDSSSHQNQNASQKPAQSHSTKDSNGVKSNNLHQKPSPEDTAPLSPRERRRLHRNHADLSLDDTHYVSKLRLKKFHALLSADHTSLSDLRALAWNGVPMTLRGTVWKMLLGYLPSSRMRRSRPNILLEKRDEYQSLVQRFYHDRTMGKTEEETNILHQIHIDTPRTNPEVPLFQLQVVQDALERILYLWSISHASGYVQGLNDLVSPFLVSFLYDHLKMANLLTLQQKEFETLVDDSTLLACEADAYFCFSLFLDMIQDRYSFGQKGIQRMVQRLENVIQRIDKPLYNHFQNIQLSFLQFSFRWMNCCLMRELSLKLILRLFDSFLSETNGKEASSFETLHVYVCAALLKRWSAHLQRKDFTELVIFLQHLPTQNWDYEDLDLLLSQAYMLMELFEP